MTFSGATSGGAHMVMSFTAPRSCVDPYLEAHGVNLERALTWPAPADDRDGDIVIPRDAPVFTAKAMEQFGITLDPKKTYSYYPGFTTPKEAKFTVLLVPRRDKVGVYMASTYPGWVRGGGLQPTSTPSR